MRVGSICSGIAADAVAWHPLGWEHGWFTEIDPYCCSAGATGWPRRRFPPV